MSVLHHARRYDVVCLDMGDTLITARNGWWEPIQGVFARAGIPMEGETVRATMLKVAEDYPPEAVGAYPPTEDFDWNRRVERQLFVFRTLGLPEDRALAERMTGYMQEAFLDPTNYRIFDDVLPTLDALKKRGYRIGLISNWAWYLPELAERLGLAAYFDSVSVSARVGASKPHPAIFHHALNQLQVEPARVIHVGDHAENDALGAQRVGMTGVLLDRAGSQQADGYPVITSLSQLLALV